MTNAPRKPSRTLLGALALVLLVFAAFFPVLTNGFVSFDDATYVTNNSHVQGGVTRPDLQWAFETSTASNWHPLTWISHMLDYQVFGLRPWGHHLTNLLLHTANTLLVFFIFSQMTAAPIRSWFLAALFGLHPLRVESVAWVAERKDVLSSLFFLLAIWAYVHWVQEASGQPARADNRASPARPNASTQARSTIPRPMPYALGLVFFTLGLLSKQMLVTLPFVLLLLDLWPLARWQPFGGDSQFKVQSSKFKVLSFLRFLPPRHLLREKVPFFFLALVFSLVVYLVQHRAGATGMIGQLPLAARLENALVAYARYLVKLCCPLDLAVFYPHPGYWPVATVLVSALTLAGISCFVWMQRQARPFWLVGWLWYLGTLVPVIGLVQVGRQSIADRYTYIPTLGVLLSLIWAVSALNSKQRLLARSAPALGLLLVLVCAGLTFRQRGFWRNTETLFRHAIEAVPDNYLAHGNLADCLQSQGKLDEAFREVDEALRLRPDDVNTRNSFGSVLLNLGRVDEAIGQFQEAIRRWPAFAEAHSNLALAYQRLGRMDQALAEAQAAVRYSPSDYRLRLNLAGLLLKLSRSPEAIEELQQALKLEPGDVTTHKDLGGLLFNTGHFDDAAREFEVAANLAPADPEAEGNLGLALARAGRGQEALPHLVRALQMRPDYPEVRQVFDQLNTAGRQ